MQHTVEYSSGVKTGTNAELKLFLQSAQEQAVAFFDALPNHTLSQLRKALVLSRAFEQVLDNPEAADALQHPALKPLLDQAAD